MRRLHYLEAEKAMLGGIMIGGDEALDRVLIADRDLFDMRHRAILQAMRRLRARSVPCGDLQLLEGELGAQALAIGLGYLAVLANSGSAALVEQYAELVRRAAMTRNILRTLDELRDGREEGDALLGKMLEGLSGLLRDIETTAVPMSEAVREACRELMAAQDAGGVWGLPTGYDALDDILGGLQVGVVTIVAGRPSMGKSAIARSIAESYNRVAGGGVHVFTPEDSRRTYALRALSDESRVSLECIRALKLSQGDFGQIVRAADSMAQRTTWLIDDTAGLSSNDIAMRVRRHARENGTKLVVVDYVQLLREDGVPAHDKRMQVELAAENLVKLARSEGIAVLLVSQLSRECEKRDDKRPMLSDLRESGALEQLAEAVLFVYRDEVYNAGEDWCEKGITEVLVRKNKNGRTGAAKLAWHAETATHRPLSYRTPEPARPSNGGNGNGNGHRRRYDGVPHPSEA